MQESATPQAAPQPSPQQQPAPAMRQAPAAGYAPGYQPGYGRGYPAGYAPYTQAQPRATPADFLTPTGGQRLGLAIASLALLIPLLAIALGVMTNLMTYVAAGVAITVGMIATALVCLAVIAVNVIFNWDALNRRQEPRRV